MSDQPDWVEEARRLVAGLGATLGQTFQEARRSAAEDGGHPAECRWCPLCQAAAVVRGERPEVATALADLLTAAAAALRASAEADAPPPRPEDRPEAPAEPAPVQRIEIA